jgi:hypothetical protein
MTWNLRGAHDDIHNHPAIPKWLQENADIVAFTETGDAGKPPPLLHGFKCLACSQRPQQSKSGGVALHVRESIMDRVRVIRDIPELGMLWFRITGNEDVYACAAYIPHERSPYLKLEGGNFSIDAHMTALAEGISKYRTKGEVLVLGDLNARTGQEDDREGERGEAWGHAPAANEGDIARAGQVGPRKSADLPKPNPHGKRLLQLCRETGMVILNGRLPGDEHGAFTFQATGQHAKRSLVDYFVASPGLVFNDEGAPRPGSALHVHDRHPAMAGGITFDHKPVVLKLSDEPATAGPTTPAGVPCDTPARFRWPEGGEGAYAQLLEGMIVDIRGAQGALTVDEELGRLESVVERAARAMHESGELGAVVVRPAAGDGGVRPHNTWYTQECKDARRVCREAERAHGAQSPAAKKAQKAYKQTHRRARRAWEAREYSELIGDMKGAPKRFWQRVKLRGQADGLRDVEGWTEYFRNLLGAKHDETDDANKAPGANPFSPPSATATQQAATLNNPFTEEEVYAALMGMDAGKSPGVNGVPVEFYQRAWARTGEGGDGGGALAEEHLLSGPITHLLNRAFREGYPTAWHLGATTPVPKPKGSLDVRDDYRGITVGNALAKLYSLVLMNRLDALAEREGYRARGQAGFRKGRGTPDNAFILQHLIEKSSIQRKPLYAAFIDFRKAYDCVHRPLLWECLKGLGVHGEFMAALTAMYDGSAVCIRIDGKVGPAFPSNKGVMQGDPMSPLLFGLFIDSLEGVLDAALPGDGVEMAGRLLRLLLYADDLILMAETPEALQRMLDVLHAFCGTHALTVNVKKSEGVVFNDQFCPGGTAGGIKFKFADAELSMVHEFPYLGMLFHHQKAVGGDLDGRHAGGQRSRYALTRRCYMMRLHNIGIKSYLFNTLVRPVLNYGCEVWGPAVMADAGGGVFTGAGGRWERGSTRTGKGLAKAARSGWRTMEEVSVQFTRASLGVRSNGQQLGILAREAGWRPLAADWLRHATRFWDKARGRPDGDLLKDAMWESWGLAETGETCWAGRLRACLSTVGHTLTWDQEWPVPITKLLQVATATWLDAATSTPALPDDAAVRAVPDDWSRGFKMLTYTRWMAADEGEPPALLSSGINSAKRITALARFRMGLHELQIERGRYERQPRSQRACCLCGGREDEAHMIFECPAYEEARVQAHELFEGIPGAEEAGLDARMREFMNPRPGRLYPRFWRDMTDFLVACFETRTACIESVLADGA